MQGLEGKVIIVTGANGNLGSAVARGVVVAGARAVLACRGRNTLERDFGGNHSVSIIDGVNLTDPAATNDCVAQAVARFGRIDGIVSTVGGFAFAEIANDSYETWQRMFAMNVQTAFNICRAALPGMTARGDGAIVLIGATAALKAPSGISAYAASKSGIMRLTESLSAEVKATGVRVNCVMPGTIDTPQNRDAMPDADRSRWVTPAALADVILFLLSDAATAMTGALIPVTGKG